MIRLASNSNCLGPVETFAGATIQKINGAKILIKIMIEKRIAYTQEDNGSKNKRVAYKPNTVSNGHDPYPNVIPIGPIPHEKPWYEIDGDEVRGGLESLLASAEDDFNFYYGILSRYYSPNELRGKSLKELDEMLQLHISVEGGLI